MQNPVTLQFLSNVLIFFGVIVAAVGSWGNYYFGNKANELKEREASEKEKHLNLQIESLADGNEGLREALEPFKEFAQRKFPSEDLDYALKRLSSDLERLEKETAKTFYLIHKRYEVVLEDGSMKFVLELIPSGENVIPLLTVAAATKGHSKIINLEVEGESLPVVFQTTEKEDKSFIKIEYSSVRPGPIRVSVHTDSKPQKLDMAVEPLSNDKLDH